MWEYFTATIDREGCYQPLPMVPDWPHINELGKEGWELVGLFDTQRQEAIAVFKRANPVTNHYGERQQEKSVVYTDKNQ